MSAHPDWIAVTKDGQPYRHWANPDLWVTCALGPYNFEFMDSVQREIVTRYKVDGIFANRWAGQGDCYCEHCQANFRNATGLDLPRGTDAEGPGAPAVHSMAEGAADELWKHFDAGIRAINPDACFIPNGPPDLKTAGELAHIQFTDNQARRGMTPPWSNGHRAKELRSVMGRRPIGGIFSVGLEEPYRWKDSVQSEPEIRLWVAEGTANGMRPWVTKFSGVLYDRRWMPMVDRIYQWHARHEAYLRNEMPLARVALLHSEQTATFHPGVAAGDRAGDHVLGMYHALIEARVPFEVVHEAFLTPDRLDPFKLLILADAAALSEAQCAAIRAYVDSRRQRAGNLCVVALRRARRQTRGLRFVRVVRGVVRRKHRRTDAELVLEPGDGPGDGKAPSDSGWSRRHTSNHQWRLPCPGPAHAGLSVTADADSELPGPADGRRLSQDSPHRLARGLSARSRPRPCRVLPLGYRSHVLGCPVRRSRPAAAKYDRVGAQ